MEIEDTEIDKQTDRWLDAWVDRRTEGGLMDVR